MNVLLALLASCSFAIGGVFMKYANGVQGITNLKPALATYGFFLVGASFQMVMMREAELGIAYVLVLGLEAILAVLFGLMLFKESVSWAKAGAMLLVVTGIALLNREAR